MADRSWGSKGAINRAGEAFRTKTLTDGQLEKLENWRIAHKQVINSFQSLLRARARARGLPVEVAQRLKRRSTIVDKLFRYPRMQLSRMDDVAGCRLIFADVASLIEFRSGVHSAKFNHIRKNDDDKYNYIDAPTDRGYRGVHDIYEYRARTGRSNECNGLLIEVQYRTQVQHAWGTAVEVVTQLTVNQPKFNRGDQRHIQLFRLASEILARVHEEKKSCLAVLSDRQVVEQFEALDAEIGVTEMLVKLAAIKWIDDQAPSKHVILHLQAERELKLHPFDLELEASRALLDLEKSSLTMTSSWLAPTA